MCSPLAGAAKDWTSGQDIRQVDEAPPHGMECSLTSRVRLSPRLWSLASTFLGALGRLIDKESVWKEPHTSGCLECLERSPVNVVFSRTQPRVDHQNRSRPGPPRIEGITERLIRNPFASLTENGVSLVLCHPLLFAQEQGHQLLPRDPPGAVAEVAGYACTLGLAAIYCVVSFAPAAPALNTVVRSRIEVADHLIDTSGCPTWNQFCLCGSSSGWHLNPLTRLTGHRSTVERHGPACAHKVTRYAGRRPPSDHNRHAFLPLKTMKNV